VVLIPEFVEQPASDAVLFVGRQCRQLGNGRIQRLSHVKSIPDSLALRESVDRYTVLRYILPRMPPTPVDQLPLTVPVFQILLSLVDRELHGYALIRDIDERTNGEVQLTASTLYGALARMLEAGLLAERDAEGDSRRRSYGITRAGRALLRREAQRLERAAAWARDKHLLRTRR
jgi:DNA-binding PadR family transcriptional regulator